MKKVFLISSPRSYSVCITRVLENVGMFEIFHEPYVPVFDAIHYPDLTKDWFKAGCFRTSKQVVGAINTASESNNDIVGKSMVLIKDMAFAIHDYMGELIDPDSMYILLFRNPLDIFVSFTNKCSEIDNTEANFIDLSGYQKLLNISNMLDSSGCKNKLVVCSDNLEYCLRKIFGFLSLEWNDDYLNLDKVNNLHDYSVKWHENKHIKLMEYWHGEALHGNKIQFRASPVHTVSDFINDQHKDLFIKNKDLLYSMYDSLIRLSV